MKSKTGLAIFTLLLSACAGEKSGPEDPVTPIGHAWMDTGRFNTKLSEEQRQQVFYHRNNEEDYQTLQDTSRIALRFFWSRSFDPFVIIRLENRPEYYNSAGLNRRYEEWFAMYKEPIQRLNHDCPVRQNDRCSGRVAPYVHQQGVQILPVNQTPALLVALDSVGFWKMKPAYPAGPHTDGSNWTLQVYYKGKYKEVTTDLPDHPLKLICLRMIRLSKYPVKKDRIY